MHFGRIKPEIIDHWLFLIIFVLIGVLIAGSVFMVYQGQYEDYQSKMAFEGLMNLETQEQLINLRFNNIAEDTLFLTALNSLENALNTNDFSGVEKDFLSFSAAKEDFDQLRFIDIRGQEIVRVNSRGGIIEAVPPEQLQDKSNRYYVIEGMKVSQGEIYVSPLDLNIENGRVESPRVPMVRFVSPVYHNGEKAGLIVINYRAASMLDELKSFGLHKQGSFYLLNSEGYYLSSPDEEQEWGFMYPGGEKKRYPLTEPELWNDVSTNDTYRYESPERVVTSKIIRPLSGMKNNNPDYFWVAVNVVSEDILLENSRALMMRLFLLGAFLFILSAAPAWALSKAVIRRRQLKRKLYYSANYDELTKLPNRHLFLDRLEQAFMQARRYNNQGALFFIDLDGFKLVNDNYGHEIGDELLRVVGERLNAGIRDSDTSARFGGDEFVVLLPVVQDIKGAEILADKLIKLISQPYRLTGVQVEVGASIGIRIFPLDREDSVDSPEKVIHDADKAMYHAKTSGKGRYSIFQV